MFLCFLCGFYYFFISSLQGKDSPTYNLDIPWILQNPPLVDLLCSDPWIRYIRPWILGNHIMFFRQDAGSDVVFKTCLSPVSKYFSRTTLRLRVWCTLAFPKIQDLMCLGFSTDLDCPGQETIKPDWDNIKTNESLQIPINNLRTFCRLPSDWYNLVLG